MSISIHLYIKANATTVVGAKLKELNKTKSAGPDGIHPRILWETRDSISKCLSNIFEKSLECGEVVGDWTTSHVVPLHKKGDKSKVENYRPVALTSICCKILESIIKDHIISYFLQNNLLAQNQFGFLLSRSTALQLLKFLDRVTEAVDSNKVVDIVYTDLEKGIRQNFS